MGRKPRPGGVLQTARIPPKFSTLSRSMSIPPHLVTFPTSSPSTAPNYPVNFHRPQLRDRACRRGAQTVSRAISFLATALSAICSCYLLSLAIWRYLPPGSPCSPLCLSPVCNLLLLPPNSDCADTSRHLQSIPVDNSFPWSPKDKSCSVWENLKTRAVLITLVIGKAPKISLAFVSHS